MDVEVWVGMCVLVLVFGGVKMVRGREGLVEFVV